MLFAFQLIKPLIAFLEIDQENMVDVLVTQLNCVSKSRQVLSLVSNVTNELTSKSCSSEKWTTFGKASDSWTAKKLI